MWNLMPADEAWLVTSMQACSWMMQVIGLLVCIVGVIIAHNVYQDMMDDLFSSAMMAEELEECDWSWADGPEWESWEESEGYWVDTDDLWGPEDMITEPKLALYADEDPTQVVGIIIGGEFYPTPSHHFLYT